MVGNYLSLHKKNLLWKAISLDHMFLEGEQYITLWDEVSLGQRR